MAHPAKLRLIAESSKKTDRNDSFHLANLLRMEYLPCSYVPERYWEEMRNLCRHRVSLGHKTTRVKNEVYALLARSGIELEHSDIFGVAGLNEMRSLNLSDSGSFLLSSSLEEIAFLTEKASDVQRTIAFYAENNKEAKILMTIPGIDYYSAMTILAEIGDITRFSNPKKLVSYAGLAPRQRDSGNTSRKGGISKEGSGVLRWILVSAVHSILRCRKGNNRLKNFYLHLVRIRKPKQVAVVATAKNLLCVIYAMLTKGEEYKEGNDMLACRKMERMRSQARPVIPKDMRKDFERLKSKVDILGGGYAVK